MILYTLEVKTGEMATIQETDRDRDLHENLLTKNVFENRSNGAVRDNYFMIRNSQ